MLRSAMGLQANTNLVYLNLAGNKLRVIEGKVANTTYYYCLRLLGPLTVDTPICSQGWSGLLSLRSWMLVTMICEG